MGSVRNDLPIAALLPAIRDQLDAGARLVVEAPTGAGKTTAIAPALLDCDWLAGQRIILLEPRRLAARAAAGFTAAQRGERVGQGIGYRIRFENRVSDATRIEVVTAGVFTRMAQADPGLQGIGAVLFDEFHERQLAADLGLAMALDVQTGLRPDLRLVVMSATLDAQPIADHLQAPILRSEGRSFAVAVHHPAARRQETPQMHLARLLPQVLAEEPGDVLVFFPGQREIRQALARLTECIKDPDVVLLPLHGSLPLAQQRAALQAAEPGTRHVILATNVAESSVTLPGIRTVIDLGRAREPRFDPRSGLTRLQTVPISQASADQRAGRAGRVAAGKAFRLWPESQRLEQGRRAEIEHADLASLALDLAAWGSDQLPWLTPPPEAAMAQARDMLRRLGALGADGRITARGRDMQATGAPPRLAAAIGAAKPDQRGLMADLLALLESRSPLRRGNGTADDLRHRLEALHVWRDGGARAVRRYGGDPATLAAIDQQAAGWRQRLGTRQRPSGVSGPLQAGNLLLPAFPDRVARADHADPLRYKLANGRGARLHPQSVLHGEPWLLALDLQLAAGDSTLRCAVPFDPDCLQQRFAHAIGEHIAHHWNPQRQTIEAFAERRLDALVLDRQRVPVDDTMRQQALLDAVRRQGLGCLPWSRDSRGLCQRVICLHHAMPDCALPACDDASLFDTLDTWLGPWLATCSSLSDLSANQLLDALRARMDHKASQQLAQWAPERMLVPSGHRHRIDYNDPTAPVLAVKLQELFGLTRTPSIAAGHLPLMLHLLSPAGRPMQVTRDLVSFWNHTYAEVRRDLRGRYPKHPWPEDPMTATATARTKRRQT